MKKISIEKLKKGDIIHQKNKDDDTLLFGIVTSVSNRRYYQWDKDIEYMTCIYLKPFLGDADYNPNRKKQEICNLVDYFSSYQIKKVTILTEDEAALYMLSQ